MRFHKLEYSWKYELLIRCQLSDSKYSRKESKKGRMADAYAHGGDEGSDKLR